MVFRQGVNQEDRDRSKRVSMTMLVPLIIAAVIAGYGIKCMVVHQGKFMDSALRGKWGQGVLVSIKGPAAVTVGLGYLCCGMFWVLFPGKRKYSDVSLLLYVTRYVCALGSLILMLWLWRLAHNQGLGIR
jgi:hypothetical protein